MDEARVVGANGNRDTFTHAVAKMYVPAPPWLFLQDLFKLGRKWGRRRPQRSKATRDLLKSTHLYSSQSSQSKTNHAETRCLLQTSHGKLTSWATAVCTLESAVQNYYYQAQVRWLNKIQPISGNIIQSVGISGSIQTSCRRLNGAHMPEQRDGLFINCTEWKGIISRCFYSAFCSGPPEVKLSCMWPPRVKWDLHPWLRPETSKVWEHFTSNRSGNCVSVIWEHYRDDAASENMVCVDSQLALTLRPAG